MKLDIYQVDAFSARPFSGNPAAVCITPHGLDAALMQQIADEMAVSETAFFNLADNNLRWFTPLAEVELCGHATLATAHVLHQTGRLAAGATVTFQTLSGPLSASVVRRGIQLDFPLLTPQMDSAPPQALLNALGLSSAQVCDYGTFGAKQLVVVSDAQRVRTLSVDFQALRALSGRGVVVTAPGEGEYDLLSRYFAPWVGVDEDPVTGSAHCALAAYWSARLGKRSLTAYQASRRGGVLTLEQTANDRVLMTGAAHTVLAGTLQL
ncbi:phenazine biosynthesis protein PhzF family [Kosakonia oryzendophytica]|uniref:Phenazine biosynthesis protein PhzF family n=1 Tax=Kosakonia oryzendophytica TaxID=1005665 RepID=A0A1C3Z8X2_9ENTR|nr:PhzF family phenazine biosynthesis protein [Kosakonia oryzendophytica]SCB78776.1 phenazine biosynthesis protein PhzF family [Kosakonia oryzendophytica]